MKAFLKTLPLTAITFAASVSFATPAMAASDFTPLANICGAVGFVPSWVPDVNGGAAFHLTFTTGQLTTQVKQLCQQQQQVQMMTTDMTTGNGVYLNAPNQLSTMMTSAQSVDPSLASQAQAITLLSQSQSDAMILGTLEGNLDAAQGRDQNVRAAAALNAYNASELQKQLTFEASTQTSDRQASLEAMQTLNTNMSGTTPDLGNGYML